MNEMLDEEWTGGPSFYAGLEWKEGEMRKREIGFWIEAGFSVQVRSIGLDCLIDRTRISLRTFFCQIDRTVCQIDRTVCPINWTRC